MNVMSKDRAITGSLILVVSEPGGAIVCRRQAENTVLRGGAQLIADLLCGRAGTPIDAVAVGVDPEPSAPPYDKTGLVTSRDGVAVLKNAAQRLILAETVPEVIADEQRVVLRFRSVLGPGVGVPVDDAQATIELGEAALGVLSEDGQSLARIYNRVVFEPIPKRREHELSLYWEISIPYGG